MAWTTCHNHPRLGTSDINADECSQVSPGKGHGGFRVTAHAGEDIQKLTLEAE